MGRIETIGIECEATGLGTGPIDHNLEDEDLPEAPPMDAPIGWLVIQVARVVRNPAHATYEAMPAPEMPQMPLMDPNMDPGALQAFTEAMANYQDARADYESRPEPAPLLVQTGLFYLSPDAAPFLQQGIPDCWASDDQWVDLAAAVEIANTATPEESDDV